jgi:hypothetical protein
MVMATSGQAKVRATDIRNNSSMRELQSLYAYIGCPVRGIIWGSTGRC